MHSVQKRRIGKTALVVVVSLALSLFVEVCVFNYRALESIGFSNVSVKVESDAISYGSNEIGAGKLAEFAIDSGDLDSISVDFDSNSKHNVIISVADEGNSVPYEIVDETVLGRETFRIHSYGAVTQVLVGSDDVQAFPVSVSFNEVAPLSISWRRVLGMGALILFFVSLLPKSPIHFRAVDKQFAIGAAVITTVCLVVLVMAGYSENGERSWHAQYQELAISMLNGHLYLDDTVPQALAEMGNPYDAGARGALGLNHQPFWDHAYFEGKFYVYFGVLPVILLYLPFRLLFGADLPNVWATGICVTLFSLGVSFLLWRICRKWFACRGGVSQALYLVALLIMLIGSWVIYSCQFPVLYSIPIVLAIAMFVWGVGFWIKATESDCIRIPCALFGSLLVALILLCRPQVLIGALVGVPLVISFVRSPRKAERGRKGVHAVLVSLLPFVAVALLAAVYNYARFGSCFDFGANYNITTNDMTLRGFDIERIPQALFAYVFQTPVLTATSPYLNSADMSSAYYGITITEGMRGGILPLTPVLLFSALILLKGVRAHMAGNLVGVVSCLLVSFVALVIFDANGAGLLIRYFMDFGIMISIASVCVVLSLLSGGGSLVSVLDAESSPSKGAVKKTASYSVAGFAVLCCLTMSFLAQLVWWFATA